MDWSIPNWIGMDRIGPKCTKYFYYILIPGQMVWGKHLEKKWWTRFLNMLWVLLSICSSVVANKGMFESKSKCIFFETLFVGIVTPSWIEFDSFFQELYFVSLHMRCFISCVVFSICVLTCLVGMAMGQGEAEGWGLRPYPAWFCLTSSPPRPAWRGILSHPIPAPSGPAKPRPTP